MCEKNGYSTDFPRDHGFAHFLSDSMDWRFITALVMYYDMWFSFVYSVVLLGGIATRSFVSSFRDSHWISVVAFPFLQSFRLKIGLKSVREKDRLLLAVHVLSGIPVYLIQMWLLFSQRNLFLVEETVGCVGFAFSAIELLGSAVVMYRFYSNVLASSRALPLSAILCSLIAFLFSLIYRPSYHIRNLLYFIHTVVVQCLLEKRFSLSWQRIREL
jgi:hypothetical protein